MKLSDAIFCDDIRYEINNKISLIGIYNDQIDLNFSKGTEIQWPVLMRLSVLLRFKFEKTEERPDQFEFEYFMNDKSITKIGEKIKVDNEQVQTNLGLTGAGIPVEPGDLGFSIKLMQKGKTLFFEKHKQAVKILQK